MKNIITTKLIVFKLFLSMRQLTVSTNLKLNLLNGFLASFLRLNSIRSWCKSPCLHPLIKGCHLRFFQIKANKSISPITYNQNLLKTYSNIKIENKTKQKLPEHRSR